MHKCPGVLASGVHAAVDFTGSHLTKLSRLRARGVLELRFCGMGFAGQISSTYYACKFRKGLGTAGICGSGRAWIVVVRWLVLESLGNPTWRPF